MITIKPDSPLVIPYPLTVSELKHTLRHKRVPFLLTTNAVITCVHGGVVTLLPKQEVVSIEGGFVLCLGDLEGAPIVGCPQAGPGIKPCTTVLAPLPGSFAPNVLVAGRPAHWQPFTAVTDGVPPGMVLVTFPGQQLVQA